MTIIDQLGLNQEQLPAVRARGKDVFVMAGAGSGKTRTLTARYLSLLEEGLPLRGILAITFTEKAAREMRSRIRQEIAQYLQRTTSPQERSFWQERYEQLNSARIGTIHSFCSELLRLHPAEAQVDPGFEVLPEADQRRHWENAIDEALAWAVEQEKLVPLLETFPPDRLRQLLRGTFQNRLDVEEALLAIQGSPLKQWETLCCQYLHLAFSEMSDTWEEIKDLLASPQFSQARAQEDKLALYLESLYPSWQKAQRALEDRDLESLLAYLPELYPSRVKIGSRKNWPSGPPRELLQKVKDYYEKYLSPLKKADWGLDRTIAKIVPLFKALFERTLHFYTT
ncbi:MAG: UvrD-helicase domain-containing protein, partial [Anaerolineae bacterium]|nr:UvrD-helicase domain-containing protein [Anaerolineae bacterium]